MNSTTAAPAIELTGLTKRFGNVRAVDGVELDINLGEIVAFLGPNGAGKTTTLDMVMGLSEPTQGTAKVLGVDPRKAATSGRISAVLQTGGLLRDLSVRETVTAIAAMHGAANRIEEVMDRTDLTRIAKRRVGKCSGGEQQRLKFALALLPDPDVLVLDEPTAGMDVTARRHFWDVMRADADAGRTILFATHYLEEAEQFAPRTVVIAAGKVIADAPTRDLRGSLGGRTITAIVPDAALPHLRAFAGVSHMSVDPGADGSDNQVSLRAEDSDAVARALLTEFGGSDLRIAEPSLESAFTELTTKADGESANESTGSKS
ncbi:MAG: ABC transporter ATP-binding protein [Galactobacter sp.]